MRTDSLCRAARAVAGFFLVLAAASSIALAQPPAPEPAPTGPQQTAALPAEPQPVEATEPTAMQPGEPAPIGAEQPRAENLPVAPETTVVGRPGSFPSEPLPSNVAVTPSLTETPASQVGSSLTIITGEQIRQSQKTSVSDVLRDVPSVDVAQQGPPGSFTSVFIRGTESRDTKVLIDGMPVNDPSNASRLFDFSLLTVDDVERIEVLRGPQSPLYGSDAVGGVVNIVTKRGQGPAQFRTDLQGGSYGTARESIGLSGGNKQGYYSFSGAYLQSDGFSSADKNFGNKEHDGLRSTTLAGRFGATPSEDFDVDYVFRYIDLDADIDDYDFTVGAPVDNLTRQNRTKAFFNRISSRLMTLDGFWEHRLGFSYIDYDRIDTAPGPYDVPRFTGFTRKVDYRSNFNLAEWDTFTVGSDYLAEDSPTNSAPFTSQTDASVYFENQFRFFDRWFTTVGARWDDYSLAGPAKTYRVTTRYRLENTKTAFHASLGTAFRAPSLAEYVYGPTLKPEQSKGWDCGVEQPLADGRFVIDGTYFRNDITDLIQFDFTTFQLSNIGRALTSGVELTATWKLDPCTSILAGYVYTFAHDLQTGEELLRRAPHKARLAVNRKYLGGRANLLVGCNYVSPRADTGSVWDESTQTFTPGAVTLEEYWLVNAATTVDLTQHWQLLARLDNILNEDYQEVFGYGTAATSFFGGFSGHW